jgi:hypothetical protein
MKYPIEIINEMENICLCAYGSLIVPTPPFHSLLSHFTTATLPLPYNILPQHLLSFLSHSYALTVSFSSTLTFLLSKYS